MSNLQLEEVMRRESGVSKAVVWSAVGAGLLVAARAAAQSVRQFDFRGKVVLIAGNSRGLGLALARELVHDGAQVAITAREQELSTAKSDLQALGGTVFSTACDLRDRASVDQMTARVLEHYGRIDVLINNAGVISVGPLEEMTLEDFREAMDANFWSMVYTTFAVLPDMKSRRSGRIVNITSIGGKIAVPHLLPYSASKFAAVGFSHGLRREAAKTGVLVTTVVPGLMRTGSPRDANFKGQNEREYGWFGIADSLPGLSMAAEDAARQILEGTRRGVTEITLSLPAKFGVLVNTLMPELTGDLLMAVSHFLPGPGGIGRNSAKGVESFSEASPSLVTTLSEQTAVVNNEICRSS